MPMIDRFEYGTIVIEGTIHHSDVMILPDGRVKTLRLAEGSVLRAKDMSKVFKAKPEVTILGRGTAGNLRLGPELESRLQQAGIELQSYRTHKAIETYRELRNQRKTAAVLHITA